MGGEGGISMLRASESIWLGYVGSQVNILGCESVSCLFLSLVHLPSAVQEFSQ